MSMLSSVRSRIRPYVMFLPLSRLRGTRRLQTLVHSWGSDPANSRSAGAAGNFAVVITPWLATAVPWFSIVTGLFLSRVEERVLAYTSTVGVEAAGLRNVVVTPSRSYYSQLGFVWNATTRAQYFELLSRALDGKCTVTQNMREDALCCYYLAQICNWIHTVFSPEAFADWSVSLQQLSEAPGAHLTVDCLSRNYPAALLNHQGRWKASRQAGVS